MNARMGVAALAIGVLAAVGCGGPPRGMYKDELGDPAFVRWCSPLRRDATSGESEGGGIFRVVLKTQTLYTSEKGVPKEHQIRKYYARLDVRDLAPFRSYGFDAMTPGAVTASYTLFTDKRGRATVGLAFNGGPPPSGTRILVRSASGPVLLTGTVADWGSGYPEHHARREFVEGVDGVTVRTGVRVAVASGRENLTFRVSGVDPGLTASLEMEGALEALVPVASARANARGTAVFGWNSRSGEPLPFGKDSVDMLAGRRFTVRVRGAVVAEGEVP